MRNLTIALLIVELLVLIGCASTNANSFSASNSTIAATLKESWHRDSAAVWEGYAIAAVDGRFVAPGFLADPGDAILKIDPGTRRFIIFAKFNRGIRTGPFQAYLKLEAELQPSATYQLRGKIEDLNVLVWLEDARTKERVSQLVSAPWGKSPESPASIPIIIPAR